MINDATEELLIRASRLDRAGEREQAIALYDQIANSSPDADHAKYAANCAAQLRSYDHFASAPRKPTFLESHPKVNRVVSAVATVAGSAALGIGGCALVLVLTVLFLAFLIVGTSFGYAIGGVVGAVVIAVLIMSLIRG